MINQNIKDLFAEFSKMAASVVEFKTTYGKLYKCSENSLLSFELYETTEDYEAFAMITYRGVIMKEA